MSTFSELEEGYVIELNGKLNSIGINGSAIPINFTCYFAKYLPGYSFVTPSNQSFTGNYLRVLFNAEKVNKIVSDEEGLDSVDTFVQNQQIIVSIIKKHPIAGIDQTISIKCFYCRQTTLPIILGTFYEVLINADKVHLVSSMKIVAAGIIEGR
jgi:hypothetical protein